LVGFAATGPILRNHQEKEVFAGEQNQGGRTPRPTISCRITGTPDKQPLGGGRCRNFPRGQWGAPSPRRGLQTFHEHRTKGPEGWDDFPWAGLINSVNDFHGELDDFHGAFCGARGGPASFEKKGARRGWGRAQSRRRAGIVSRGSSGTRFGGKNASSELSRNRALWGNENKTGGGLRRLFKLFFTHFIQIYLI